MDSGVRERCIPSRAFEPTETGNLWIVEKVLGIDAMK